MTSRENGMALIIAVWAVILIGAFVAGMVTMGGGDAAIAANRIDAARAQHLAEAGVYRAIAGLVDPVTREKLPLAQPFSVQLEDEARIIVQVRDSCGAIDLNWAPSALLRAYGVTMGMKPAAAERFSQAVAARQQASLNPETAALSSGPWQSLDQLADIPDIDSRQLQAMRSGLTINCREVGADPCCATDTVKQALGLAGAGGSPSHKLAYDIIVEARLSSGAKVMVQATIWLSRAPGPPLYYITGWRTQ